jgi:hypothetical protein
MPGPLEWKSKRPFCLQPAVTTTKTNFVLVFLVTNKLDVSINPTILATVAAETVWRFCTVTPIGLIAEIPPGTLGPTIALPGLLVERPRVLIPLMPLGTNYLKETFEAHLLSPCSQTI